MAIEHNLEVTKTAEWVIDTGREGGDGGGTIVAQGTPEDIAADATSHAGRFLREVLARRPISRGGEGGAKAAEKKSRVTKPMPRRAAAE